MGVREFFSIHQDSKPDLLDPLGRVVRHEIIERDGADTTAFTLNIADLPAGAYTIRITTKGVTGIRPLRIIH